MLQIFVDGISLQPLSVARAMRVYFDYTRNIE